MKRVLVWLIVLSLLTGLLTACGSPDGGPAGGAPQPPAIRPLKAEYRPAEFEPLEDAEPWSRCWAEPDTVYADLTHSPGLTYSLMVGNNTAFPGGVPVDYDQQELIEWGKDPGLNVDILHAHGFTGKGAVVAYIDQGLLPHEEYDRENLHVTNTGEALQSWHGPAVTSLLAGKSIGVAPDAEVYYFGHDSDKDAQLHQADCLYRVMALNETLPEGKKIRMVGFSDNISSGEAHEEEFREAANACAAAGIMVWFCGENGALAFLPHSDKNDPGNLMPEYYGLRYASLVYVPAAGRTVACVFDPARYVYCSFGGLSWTMPYTLGLYAIALTIVPTFTQDELRKLIMDTADPGTGQLNTGDVFTGGELARTVDIRIVNPVGFVAAALERVGRSEEATALRDEVKARQRYLYAVLDLEKTGREDRQAILNGLAWVTDTRVLVADASRFGDETELYAAIAADLRERGGTLAGYQLFGDVPPPPNGAGEGEAPPVRRLSLAAGEYVTFFENRLAAIRAGEPEDPAEERLFPLNRAAVALCTAEGTLG